MVVWVVVVVVSPPHTGPKLVPGSRGTSFEVVSLNTGNRFLGKKQHIKIICLQLSSHNYLAKDLFKIFKADFSIIAEYVTRYEKSKIVFSQNILGCYIVLIYFHRSSSGHVPFP